MTEDAVEDAVMPLAAPEEGAAQYPFPGKARLLQGPLLATVRDLGSGFDPVRIVLYDEVAIELGNQASTRSDVSGVRTDDLLLFVHRYGRASVGIASARIKRLRPHLHIETQRAYNSYFTLSELAAMRKFYSSPQGRSIARKQTMLLGALAGIGEPYAQSIYSLDQNPPSVNPPPATP